FFGGISDAFSYFGGTTRIAKSDNMKQWVKKYDRYEPAFNDAAVEWAAYYDTTLQTCRIRTPRDKGPVEGLVQKTYNAVYALLHDEVFYNLLSMNARIYELMDGFNEKP
ncbi:IS21 family transposase, partial [Segatella copri]